MEFKENPDYTLIKLLLATNEQEEQQAMKSKLKWRNKEEAKSIIYRDPPKY